MFHETTFFSLWFSTENRKPTSSRLQSSWILNKPNKTQHLSSSVDNFSIHLRELLKPLCSPGCRIVYRARTLKALLFETRTHSSVRFHVNRVLDVPKKKKKTSVRAALTFLTLTRLTLVPRLFLKKARFSLLRYPATPWQSRRRFHASHCRTRGAANRS